VSYGDQVCAWITRLHEGLQFAARYPDTDVAQKNMRLYVSRLRDLIKSVARDAPTARGAGNCATSPHRPAADKLPISTLTRP